MSLFLFLSKLIPLFVYPLGLSCVLLILALLLWWKLPRLVPIPIALALIILLLSSNTWVSEAIIRSLEWQHLPVAELPQAEAIVILGGSTAPASLPRTTVEISDEGDRVLYGAKLYRDGKAPLIIPAGGRIGWIDGGSPEAEDMAQLLQTMGVPPQAIIPEPESLNTYENAVNVKKILTARNIKQILLVTSAMHMPRSLLIFKRQGIDAIPAPTDFYVVKSSNPPEDLALATLLDLLPDAEKLYKTTRAIKEYIGTIVYRLRGWL